MYCFSSALLSKLRNRLSARAAWGLCIGGLLLLLGGGDVQAQPRPGSGVEVNTADSKVLDESSEDHYRTSEGQKDFLAGERADENYALQFDGRLCPDNCVTELAR